MGIVAASAAPALAQDRRARQFRELELTDGRTLVAEVLSTEPTGLLLRTPQGDTLVSFEILLDMRPTDADTYEAQGDWVVYVDMDDELQPTALELLAEMEGLSAHKVGAAVNGLSPEAAANATDCDASLGCIIDATKSGDWMWVLTSEEQYGTPVLRAGLNTGGTRTSAELASIDRDGMWTALHEVLGFEPPSSGAPRQRKNPNDNNPTDRPSTPTKFTKQKVAALSFVPLPGVPSMAQKDGSNVALAWGLALPVTGAFAGAAYAGAGDSPGEFVGMTVGGYYLATVFANQVAGMRSLKAKGLVMTPMPLEEGGGVMMAAQLR